MKILSKNKIVEAFGFPISEALVFSILVWNAWGLAEAFYWDVFTRLFDPTAVRVDPYIYVEAFLIYLVVAAVIAILVYSLTKMILAILHSYDTYLFRGITLSVILGLFFLMTIHVCYYNYLVPSSLGRELQIAVTAGMICLAIVLTWLLFKWASGVGFRIRRSGTMMLSIAVLSIVLSFVRFPIFSTQQSTEESAQQQSGFHKLIAYYYVKPLLKAD